MSKTTLRCECGDSECKTCGTEQGTRTPDYNVPLAKAEREALISKLPGCNVPGFKEVVAEATAFSIGYYWVPVTVFRDLHTGEFAWMKTDIWRNPAATTKRTHQQKLVTITPHVFQS